MTTSSNLAEKAIITCALTGVLTDPKQHPVPVTAKEMAASARDAYNAGACMMHVHLRRQEEGMGHLPSWDPDVAEEIINEIRAACPGVIINLTTGVSVRLLREQVVHVQVAKHARHNISCFVFAIVYEIEQSPTSWSWCSRRGRSLNGESTSHGNSPKATKVTSQR